MEKNYKEGEIVWAKIRGYPWWPGVIGQIFTYNSSNLESKALINFIGDSTHAYIEFSKIKKYQDKYEEFSRSKKRALLHSVDLANKIIKGEINFNEILVKEQTKKNLEKHNTTINCPFFDKLLDKRNAKKSNLLLNNKREREINIEERLSRIREEPNLVDEIKQSIEDLLLCQTTLLNHRAIYNQVDNLYLLIKDADINEIPFKMICNLLRTLVLYVNKSSSISLKATELIETIKEKFLFELFGNNLQLEVAISEFSSYERNDLISDLNKETKLLEIEDNNLQSSYKRLTKVNRKISEDTKLDDEYSMYDMSIQSTNTDCEEVKPKMKIKLLPLDKKEIYSILVDYFSDRTIENEDDFCNRLNDGILLKDNFPSQNVKLHYLRKRVCYRLYSVFEPLLKELKIRDDLIKHLAKYLEYKAREVDPEMGVQYKNSVTNIFNKIKVRYILIQKNKFAFVSLDMTTNECH